LGTAATALAQALPTGHVRALDGQTHDIVPAALAPVLLEFFGGGNMPGDTGLRLA
jgi:hypothetical protein